MRRPQQEALLRVNAGALFCHGDQASIRRTMNVKYVLPTAFILMLVCASCGGGSGSNTVASPTPTPTPTPPPTGQIAIVSSFAGDTRGCATTTPQGCRDHPDPAIAVGPAYVVLFNRQGLTVYNKDGSLFQPTIYAPAFWAAAGIPGILQSNVTDPHAAYDIFTHRYLITDTIMPQANCGDLLAVSAADDPTHWKA